MKGSPAASESPRSRRLLALGLAAIALVIYLPSIGVGDFVGDDEALDAGVVAEMTRTGDWLFPEFNGEYLPPKPPLFYWAARAVSAVRGGADEASLRIPSALAAAALVGLTSYALAATEGATTGALAGSLLLTMPVMRDQARAGRCDMLLALLVAGCLFLARSGWERAWRRWLFTVCLGLAAITKGGAGVGIVAVTLLADAAAERSLRRLRVFVDPAMVAFVILGASWYALGAAHWGRRFVDEQIVGENLNHLIGGTAISDRNPGTRGIVYHLGYYPQNLLATMLPWSLCLPLLAVDWWRSRSIDERSRFFAAWLFASVVFLTAAARKSPYYVLPLAPAMAALAAGWLSSRIEQARAVEWSWPPLSAKLLIGLAGAIGVLWLAAVHAPAGGCRGHAVSESLRQHPFATIGSIWLLAVAAVALALAVRGRDWASGTVATICALGSLWLFLDHVEGRVADCGSLKPFAREVAQAAPEGAPLFFFKDPLPAVALYAERRIPTLRDPGEAPADRPFSVIVPESLRDEAPAAWLAAGRVLASARGRVYTRRPMGIELLAVPPRAAP